MPSRVFNSIVNRLSKHHGGRGMKSSPTRVVRLPEDCLIELDNLLQDYKQRSASSPNSPRYHFLNHFVSEIEEILVGDRD